LVIVLIEGLWKWPPLNQGVQIPYIALLDQLAAPCVGSLTFGQHSLDQPRRTILPPNELD
jgi:hypothetical protein